LAAFLGYLIPIILPVMLTNISTNLGATTGAVGVLIGVQSIAVAIASLFVGTLSDRYGRQHLLSSFLLINGFALIIMGSSPNLPVLYVTGVFSAVAFSPLVFGTLAYIGDHYDEKTRPALVGLVTGSLYAGVTFGIPLTVWLMDAKDYGWRGVLIVFGAISLVSSGIAWACLDKLPKQTAAASTTSRDVLARYVAFFRERRLLGTLIVFFVIRLGVGMYYTYGPAYLIIARDFPPTGFLLVYSVGAVFAFIASLFSAKIIGLIGIHRLVLGATVSLIASMFLIISFPTTQATIVLLIGAFCTMYMLSEALRMAALHTDAVSKVDISVRGSFLGLINFLVHSGTALGALLGGGIVTWASIGLDRAAQMQSAYSYIVISAATLWLVSVFVFMWYSSNSKSHAPSVA